jgi:hypothetical protein
VLIDCVVEKCKSKNKNHMEPGPSIKKQNKNDKGKTSYSVPNVRNVFQPLWIRRDSDHVDEFDRLILRRQFDFVLPCGILLWIIFLLLW